MTPPASGELSQFERMDLGREDACDSLVQLLKKTDARAVVHLAFVIDPVRNGVLDTDRMWQINVAGTARVMEAITESNRRGGTVRKFVFPSSVAVYGTDYPKPAAEELRLTGHSLLYAIHKRESDEVVQRRAEQLGHCASYILRPPIFVGPSIDNYMIGVLRGTPSGRGRLARRWRAQGKRLPILLPYGDRYLRQLLQFIHIDDMARLIAWTLRQPERDHLPKTTVLNVAGRGEALTVAEAIDIAQARVKRLPTRGMCRRALRVLWNLGLSGVPPEALPYMLGPCTMDVSRLQCLLGHGYQQVIRFTMREALADSFAAELAGTPSEPHEAEISEN